MISIDEMKMVIEETREELNKLIVTKDFEKYYTVSKKLDALIEEYIDAQASLVA